MILLVPIKEWHPAQIPSGLTGSPLSWKALTGPLCGVTFEVWTQILPQVPSLFGRAD